MLMDLLMNLLTSCLPEVAGDGLAPLPLGDVLAGARLDLLVLRGDLQLQRRHLRLDRLVLPPEG